MSKTAAKKQAAQPPQQQLTEQTPIQVRGPSVLSQFRFNSDVPFVARAALRSIGASLNFQIAALVAQHLRQLRFGQPVEETDEHYGHNLDQRNEMDAGVEGDDFEHQLRTDQGFDVLVPPLELAARLKIIRDSCANELNEHAGMRKNSLTGQLFKNPFDLVSSVEESFAWQMNQPARISEVEVKDAAQALGLDEQSIRVQLEKRYQSQQKFLKDNAAEIYSIIDTLTHKDSDGHVYTIDDDESVEERLPAINRARLFVAADKGLVNQRGREVDSYMRRNPNARGNIEIIDKERALLRAKFDTFMKIQWVKDEINEATQRGARYPELMAAYPPLPKQEATK